MCKADATNWCMPYTINWMVIARPTKTTITRTPAGDASNAMSPRKDISEVEDTSVQKVGMRDDKEKETYEPYMSRARHYEKLSISTWGDRGRECTHNESLQVHPIITEQEPYVTGNPEATCGAASGNGTVCIGVNLEDGTWSYCQYRSVHTSRCY